MELARATRGILEGAPARVRARTTRPRAGTRVMGAMGHAVVDTAVLARSSARTVDDARDRCARRRSFVRVRARAIEAHREDEGCDAEARASITNGPREDLENMFGADYSGDGLTTQGEAVVKGVAAVQDKPSGLTLDIDYLQELIAIQDDCPKEIGFFGTRNMGFMHQQLIEILAYALCLTGNHIYTSGATGTNAAVIRGALRAEKPELLTVVLPQSLAKQPRESRELLEGVKQVVEKPENDGMPLVEASRICNDAIVSKVKQIIVFAFHDSRLLLETCRNAKSMRKLVTLFYLD